MREGIGKKSGIRRYQTWLNTSFGKLCTIYYRQGPTLPEKGSLKKQFVPYVKEWMRRWSIFYGAVHPQRMCRGGGPRSLQKLGITKGMFSNLFEVLMKRCNKEDLELFAVTARKIWLRRNSVVHGEPFSHPTQLIRDAQNSLEEFQRIHYESRGGMQITRDTVEAKWKPPPENMIKLNWDAGINKFEGRIDIGLIARDSRRSCLAARSLTTNAHTDATTAKALAAVHAIMFCKELGYTNILFEGDAQQVIRAIGEEGPCFSSFGHLIDCIHNELRDLERDSFIHVLREANGAAHLLAQLATTHVNMFTWLGNAPPSVGDIVKREKSLLLV